MDDEDLLVEVPPRDIAVLRQNADSLISFLLLSASSSKRFIIWRSLFGQRYYFCKIFKTLRLSSVIQKVITAPKCLNCSLMAYLLIKLQYHQKNRNFRGSDILTNPDYASAFDYRNTIDMNRSLFFHVLEKTYLLSTLNQCFNNNFSQITRKVLKSRKIQKLNKDF